MHTGGTPENPLCIRCTSGVPPEYLRCTQREGPENRAVRSEMNPKSAGLPKVYPQGGALSSPRAAFSPCARALMGGANNSTPKRCGAGWRRTAASIWGALVLQERLGN
jgi:hypothetical protein